MKIFLDYKLNIRDFIENEKVLNWKPSSDAINITNDFNLGIEIKSALAPFHEKFPSGIINIKVNEIALFISRKVLQTLFKF
jgi:hypothetical protein